MTDFTNKIDSYFDKLKHTIDNLDRDEINHFINLLLDARDKGKFIFIMGNGGSAATASHFVCDFNKGASYGCRGNRFKFICLNDNSAELMAYANDVGYEDVFVEPLKNFLNEGDVVIGISGSGNSRNVLKAITYANDNNAITVGITGYDGGILKSLAHYSVNVNVDDMQISEDIHMIFDHLSMSILKSC